MARLETTARELQQQSEALTRQTRELEAANLSNRRRALQFQAVAEISRAITELRELDELLPNIAQTVSARNSATITPASSCSTRSANTPFWAASNSERRPARMLRRGHRLEVGKRGIVGYVAAAGIPRVALDVGQDAVYFDNPDLPETHSEIALPLTSEGQVIGVLDVQSTERNAFDQQDIEILSTLAAQIGAAIENARRFQGDAARAARSANPVRSDPAKRLVAHHAQTQGHRLSLRYGQSPARRTGRPGHCRAGGRPQSGHRNAGTGRQADPAACHPRRSDWRRRCAGRQTSAPGRRTR